MPTLPSNNSWGQPQAGAVAIKVVDFTLCHLTSSLE